MQEAELTARRASEEQALREHRDPTLSTDKLAAFACSMMSLNFRRFLA